MEEIQTKGSEVLSDDEKKISEKLLAEYYPKIKRKIKNIVSLNVNFKIHDNGGNRKRYEVVVKVDYPGGILEAQSEDWDFSLTLHKVLKKVEREAEGRFKI